MSLVTAFFAMLFSFGHAAQVSRVSQQPIVARAIVLPRSAHRPQTEFALHDATPQLQAANTMREHTPKS